jgi:hypothetical protein
MKRSLIVSVLGALALLLATGVATAAAASPGVQTVSQSAGSAQQATSASGATQIAPSNTNISVRVLSPGNDGAVTQTNSASSGASSTNSNSTNQSASQDQSSGGIQTADQSALNGQAAGALSSASQYGASNQNLPVRVLSPGNDGPVTQSNLVSSNAGSTNTNTTTQSSDQTQSGGSPCGCAVTPATSDPAPDTSDSAPDTSTTTVPATPSGSGGDVQSSDQSAGNAQLAGAASSAQQVDPSNTNIDVRVLSPGDDGPVTQSNSVQSNADASNSNSTTQTATQDPESSGPSCGCGSSPGIQDASQSADNLQVAGAASEATQVGAQNVNLPVRVLSPGNDGSVDQSNKVDSNATASNHNSTTQNADQEQSGSGGCGCASDPIQVADQSSGSLQGAFALSAADQSGAKNENSPVRVGSSGNGGSVDQSNTVDSGASSTNWNDTKQTADQSSSSPQASCGCGDGSVGIQVIGQQADNGQAALSASSASQDFGKSDCGCSSGGNSNDPVRVWSPGNDGSVDQSNKADSNADSANGNWTSQDGSQSQSGSGIQIQALGQEADNGQLAGALSGVYQQAPSNDNGGARVYSPGNGGSVDQSNDAGSKADAGNWNSTKQNADQSQSGSGGCSCGSDPQIQALGQQAGNLQAGFAFSTALQLGPKNADCGPYVWSPGNGGPTRQSNNAGSIAGTLNLNGASQTAGQMQ